MVRSGPRPASRPGTLGEGRFTAALTGDEGGERVLGVLGVLGAGALFVVARIEAFAEGLTEAALGGAIRYRNNEGRDLADPVDLLIAHFFNHQTHHRGQAHALITAAGERTEDTDLFLVVPEVKA